MHVLLAQLHLCWLDSLLKEVILITSLISCSYCIYICILADHTARSMICFQGHHSKGFSVRSASYVISTGDLQAVSPGNFLSNFANDT